MIERLRALLGPAAVRAARDDDAVHGTTPQAVVEPDGADGCAAALAECSAQGWSVEVAGGRSARHAGRPVEQVDVLLGTRRMSGVVEYEPDDLTIGVAAGTTIAELRARVAASQQRVPLDVRDEHATVGGVLARAAAGPMRRSWGTPRRQVLGVELVTGDGRVLHVGGRVVKNVAGYDLNKAIVGSAGTLGVITRVHLRLLPVPVATATVVLDADAPEPLLEAARALLEGPVQPAALELVAPHWRMVALYEGAAEAVRAGVDTAGDLARHAGVGMQRDDAALGDAVALEAASPVVVRLAHLPARLARTLDVALGVAGTGGACVAHAGDGIVRVMARSSAPGGETETLARAVQEARDQMEGGTVIVERGTRDLMRAVDPWGPQSDAVLRLTVALRRQFDPAGILQRGRWIA